ncbi:flippase [Bifidobacterium mongoliense]|uniref:flippase n=2 Tax=Bifidobacterium mongoliense TaxID=518643 RepID=UPI0030EBE819
MMTIPSKKSSSKENTNNLRVDRQDSPKIRSVKFNVLMNMLLTSSQFVFPLITVPYVSRILSTYGTGAVAFAQSVVSYFSLLALLGISTYGVRVCAVVRDNREKLSCTVQELFMILLLSSSVVYILYLISVFSIPQMSNDKGLFLISSASIWLGSMGVEWFYQAIEQYGYITMRNIAFKLISLVLMFIFVKSQGDYRVYALITVFANGGSNVLNLLRLRKFVDFSFKRKLCIRRHFKPMRSFMVMTIANGMFSQADLVILGFLGTPSMVGLYQLVAKTKNLAYSVVNSVSNVMLPRLSYYKGDPNKKRYSTLLFKNFNFLTLSSLAGIGICVLAAKPIVLILGGENFLGSVVPLKIAAISLIFSAYNTLLAQDLIASGKETYFSIVCCMNLVIAIAYNVFLIPIFGVTGAAMSMTLCELTQTGILFLVSRKVLAELLKRSQLGRIAFSAAISYVIGAVSEHFVAGSGAIIQFLVPTLSLGVSYGLLLLLTGEYFVSGIFASVIRRVMGERG